MRPVDGGRIRITEDAMDDTRTNPKPPARALHAVVERGLEPARAMPAAAPDPGVDRLQRRLNHLDYRDAAGRALPVDGVFGERPGEALVEFQRAHGLRADGVPGPRTPAALYPAEVLAPTGRGDAAGAVTPGRVA